MAYVTIASMCSSLFFFSYSKLSVDLLSMIIPFKDILVILTIRLCVHLHPNVLTKSTATISTNIVRDVNTIIYVETNEHIITQLAIMVIDSTKN